MWRTKDMVLCGVLTALAAVCSYIEALIPFNFGVPGIKLGLANVVIVFALFTLGFRKALLISFLRIALVSALFGNAVMALYSGAGALLSLLVMGLLYRTERFSIIGISMMGGVFHNIGQLTTAILVVETPGLLGYLPVLIGAGTATGVLIGIITAAAGKHAVRIYN